jgi:aryl-alcohol dehydrogenase-like predicted oxidoreductase
MRLSTDEDGAGEASSVAVIRAALAAGVRLLDTARAYGRDAGDLGHNEALVARAIEGVPDVRVATKCGMRRDGRAWVPDGRASTILADAAASAERLGRASDLLLLHAVDPRTPLATSARALAKARDEGLARAIGLCNVTRGELEAAEAEGGPFAAVEVALGAYDDVAARGGLVALASRRRMQVIAHSPFGGPPRAPRLARDPAIRAIAERLGATPHEVVLAYLLALDPCIVPIPGARRVATAESLARASAIVLDDAAVAALDARFPGLAVVHRPVEAPSSSRATAEVVMIMGLPGAGKSVAAEPFVSRGFLRLNRDTLGGSLAGIVKRLESALRAGVRGAVLDNTYVTRALRSDVVRAAHAHGARVRCIFVDTPPGEAQVNVVSRILERHGRLLGPEELRARAKKDPTALAPTAVFRMLRELERPSSDEGFAAIDVVPFVRRHPERGAPSLAVSLDAIAREEGGRLVPRRGAPELRAPAGAPVLVFAWRPGATDAWREEAAAFVAALGLDAELDVCPHAAGPPACWCRPPLPGLWVAFARRRNVDPRASVLVGTSAAHATMARTLGLVHVQA